MLVKPKREKLQFEGVENKDVYNITAPFELGGKTYIAGRVESPENTADTRSVFFIKKDGVWWADDTFPSFPLEDPFITKINGEMVFGGVETYPLVDAPSTGWIGYRTLFYKGKALEDLKQFSVGPDMMKDIRLVELADHSIGVFTRPQGSVGGKGTIGFVRLNSLDELTPENILKAQLFLGQFSENEWGGVNNAYLLHDGTIGVIGHVGSQDTDGKKHYRAMSFIFNPNTFHISPIKIIAERKDFPKGKSKVPELEDIVFPGGYENGGLYVGLSDSEAGYLHLSNPFKK